MTTALENRIKSREILASDKSNDLKLFEIFQIYKSDIQNEYTELYYTLLRWENEHLKKLQEEIKQIKE